MENRHLFEKAAEIVDTAPTWKQVQEGLAQIGKMDRIFNDHPEHVGAHKDEIDNNCAFTIFFQAVRQAADRCHRPFEGKNTYEWLITNRAHVIKDEIVASREELKNGWTEVQPGGDTVVKKLPPLWSNHRVEGMVHVAIALGTDVDTIPEINTSQIASIACNVDRHEIATSKRFLERIRRETAEGRS